MRRKQLLILALLMLPLLAGGGYSALEGVRASRELDGLIAALPDHGPTCVLPIRLPEAERRALTPAALMDRFETASKSGVGAKIGERGREMVLRRLILDEIELRLVGEALSPTDRRLIADGLRADLARDPQWSRTLRANESGWLHWVARMREGQKTDEDEILGPPSAVRRLIGGRRLSDAALLSGWRAIERFHDRIDAISPMREDYGAALDAAVTAPAPPTEGPVGAYFARFATRDLKSSQQRYVGLRAREESLLEDLQ